MKVIVYDKNTKKSEFNNYGYGKLRLVEKCEVVDELNGRYDLELIVNREDSKAHFIKKWAIINCDGQLFRVIDKYDYDKENKIKVFCKHIFYDLNFGFIEDSRAEGKQVVEAMKLAIPYDFKDIYEVSSDITDLNTLYFVKNYGADSMFEIIERWGQGELIRDNFKVTINKNKGMDNGVIFTYKKIDAIEITEETENVVTRLYPTGKDGISLKEKYVYIPSWNEEDYLPFHITREVKFENAENEGDLRILAQKEAEKIGLSKVNFSIKVNELANTSLYKSIPSLMKVETGDIVTIKHKKLNVRIKVKCIKKTHEKVTDSLKLEFGQPSASFFDSVDNSKVDVVIPEVGKYKEKIFYYSNGVKTTIKSELKSVAFLRYGVIERSNLMMYFNAFMNCKVAGDVNIKFVVNNVYLDFSPTIHISEGKQYISFTYPLIGVEPNVAQSMDISMSISNGEFDVESNGFHIVIKGQNVSGGNGGERPHADVVETFNMNKIENKSLTLNAGVVVNKIIPNNLIIKENFNLNKVNGDSVDTRSSVEISFIAPKIV